VAFSDWLNETFGLTSPAWQVLCAGAALCSLSAAISTQLLKSYAIEEHVARAEAVRAKLEALELGRITGRLTPEQVATEYTACIEQATFL
jgi:hydroxymethylpyrimidine/phosphomethylpyrimidine kinase